MRETTLLLIFMISVFVNAQTTLYVNPDGPNGGDGTITTPYNDIAIAVDIAANAGGGDVIVVDGEYNMTGREIRIATAATLTTAVTIKPQTTAGVKLNFKGRFGFDFEITSNYITLEGFELDGETDSVDYWSIVAQAFWGDDTVPTNGGLAVILDGQNITIKDNHIHNWYQKAVEIRDARYVVVAGNIIHDIATTSLTGGHGIMRQQKGQEFFDDDLTGVYRWDIRENMIFNVAQRIYSWVPSKGFIEMVIDEGKSILIDDPKDTDEIQEQMSARIKNNIVAFGTVDHIRLKSTPNLEVSHNSIYAEGVNADGISDKQGDTDTPQFINFIAQNNAAQTVTDVSAIEIDKAVEQADAAGGSGTALVSGNYAMDGRIKPTTLDGLGLTKLTNGQLFINPSAGNFRINPALNLPSSTGVEPQVLDDLDAKVTAFDVTIAAVNLDVDHLKLGQTILDNIPGLNDGIANNETIFVDYGNMSSNYHSITFDVVDGDWKNDTGSPNQQDFELNEAYYTWYENVATTYLNSTGSEYERIRWGNSEVRQDQLFDADWLTVSQITDTENTLINGYDNHFTLDGDLLIDFVNFTPTEGDEFDLIIANTITSNNTGDLFNRLLFEGFTPDNYTLEVVNVFGGQALRLSITSPALDVNTFLFENKKNEISPNPSNDFFELYIDHPISKIQMFDILGKNITQKVTITSTDYGYIFYTSALKPGLYLLTTDNKTVKVVIK